MALRSALGIAALLRETGCKAFSVLLTIFKKLRRELKWQKDLDK